MNGDLTVDAATERLVDAVARWQGAVDADPHADSDADAWHAHELMKVAARDLTAAVDNLPPGRQPADWAALAEAGGDARLMPTGTCYCGCGDATTIGAYFLPGHDKRAEAAVVAARYGNQVVRLLAAHGFGPDRSVVDAAVADGGWMACPSCGFKGAPASVAAHQRRGCPGPVESPELSTAIAEEPGDGSRDLSGVGY